MEEDKSQNIYKIIGEKIKAHRKGKKTQEQLADCLYISRTSLTNFETGKQRVQIDTLWEIAEQLGITIQDLLPTKEEVGTALEDHDKDWIESVIQDATKVK